MLIFSIFSLLFSNALTLTKEKAIFYSRTTILTLIVTCFICYANLHVMNLEKGIGLYGGIFNISSLTQSFNIFIFLITSIVLIYNAFYHRLVGSNTTQLADTNLDQYKIIEYPLIILFIICGAVFLMTSGDLISLFISIELQSYGLYILSTVHRDSEQATWGGLTYFLLGGLSSCFILLGSSLLYINTGTTSLDGIYIITSITDMTSNLEALPLGLATQDDIANYAALPLNIGLALNWHYINISLTLLCVGFLFKISAAPFHFWSPDVYDAIPTVVTTTVAIIAKLSIFVILLELVYFISSDSALGTSVSWKNCLLISSLFSLIIGSVLGLTQYRIKRVYAYSTISHVGFILLALSVDSTESIQAYIFYILSYTISNLNAFVILVTIGYTMYLYVYNDDKANVVKDHESETTKLLEVISNKTKSIKTLLLEGKNSSNLSLKNNLETIALASKTKSEIKDLSSTIEDSKKNISYNKSLGLSASINSPLKDVKYSPVQLVSQLKGYFYINSYLALSLAITLFSFMGIPPLVGFFAKQMVLSAALDNGYIFITLVGILTSVIGAVYYLNIVKQMFFFKSDYVINPFLKASLIGSNAKGEENVNISISSALSVIISIMTLLLLLFIFIPNESFNLAKILTLCLFN
jgi:NADH-ubiquinone oxidoreductase chain 2